MYYQGEIEKKDRRKVITIATAIVAVVLVLIVAIIVVATRKSGSENVGGSENANFALDENANKAEEPKEEAKTEDTGSTETVTVSKKTATETTETATSVPSTGPEDVLPMALGLGSLTTAVTAYIMSKMQA